MLWETWRKGKKVKETKIAFSELIKNLEKDYDDYRDSKEKGEEIIEWKHFRLIELYAIRNDINSLISKIKSGLRDSQIRQECECEFGIWWLEKVALIIEEFLPALQREVTLEIALRRGHPKDLQYIKEADWNPRRRKIAEEKLQKLQSR